MFSIINLLKEFTDESSAILCSLQAILSHSSQYRKSSMIQTQKRSQDNLYLILTWSQQACELLCPQTQTLVYYKVQLMLFLFLSSWRQEQGLRNWYIYGAGAGAGTGGEQGSRWKKWPSTLTVYLGVEITGQFHPGNIRQAFMGASLKIRVIPMCD